MPYLGYTYPKKKKYLVLTCDSHVIGCWVFLLDKSGLPSVGGCPDQDERVATFYVTYLI